MPFTQVFLRRGKPPAYKAALLDGLYRAMRETFGVPEDDRFMVVSEFGPDDFVFSRTYLGIARSDDLVIVQLTVSDTRGPAQKQALYRAIVENLVQAPGVRPEDVFINLVEVKPENWSFGHGLAQYVTAPPPSRPDPVGAAELAGA